MRIAEKISSLQNPRVKEIVKLYRSKNRKENNLIVVEGIAEIKIAVSSGLKAEYFMIHPALFNETELYGNKDIFGNTPCFEVNSQVFNKITYRQNNEGILAVMQAGNLILNDIKLSNLPLIIVMEAVEKPGNLGAVLRTADAVGADAVIVCDPQTDIYNPNVIRSSLGCVFTKQIAVCSSEEALQWLKTNNIEPVAASLSATKLHFNTNLNKPVAFIMGTEASGLTDFWLQNSKTQVLIPMLGKIDSLNVSVSMAILVYEALRQRNYAGSDITAKK